MFRGLQARWQGLGSSGFWINSGRAVRAADARRVGTHPATQVLAVHALLAALVRGQEFT